MVSIARVVEGDPKPVTGMIATEPATKAHSAFTTWHRATTTADKVIEKLTADGTPTLVMLAKQRWADMAKDPSAQRRLQIYNLIEERLHRRGIPVAEFPYVTALAWMSGYAPRNVKGATAMTQLSNAVTAEWEIKCPTYSKNGQTFPYPMRIWVAALAAVGAMALGIETTIKVTEPRLETIGGVKNQGVQWPGNLSLPRTLSGWKKRNADPSVCWKDADAGDDTDTDTEVA